MERSPGPRHDAIYAEDHLNNKFYFTLENEEVVAKSELPRRDRYVWEFELNNQVMTITPGNTNTTCPRSQDK